MCVCLAFLWHVCFPPKKNPSSARLGSWQLVILETLCGAACQVTLSSWTWKILWDPVERMLIADDEWKFWCWKWINCLYFSICLLTLYFSPPVSWEWGSRCFSSKNGEWWCFREPNFSSNSGGKICRLLGRENSDTWACESPVDSWKLKFP